MRKFVLFVCVLSLHAQAPQWHTSPDSWTTARIFHEPLSTPGAGLDFASWVKVERGPISEDSADREFSPNQAYWFRVHHDDCSQPAAQARITTVEIFQERDRAVMLRLTNDDKCTARVHWINEKLLFVRVWWGRIMGSDIIFDVEREQVIFHEKFTDGWQAFHQFQQVREGRQP